MISEYFTRRLLHHHHRFRRWCPGWNVRERLHYWRPLCEGRGHYILRDIPIHKLRYRRLVHRCRQCSGVQGEWALKGFGSCLRDAWIGRFPLALCELVRSFPSHRARPTPTRPVRGRIESGLVTKFRRHGLYGNTV